LTGNKQGRATLGLKMIVTGSALQAGVMVQSWQEAVDRAGGLLLKSGLILPGYIEAMKNAIYDMGPYMVIAPGIVLLHARPEEGVIKTCLALITLAQPVNFGHSENDPVDLVFAMGAVDKDAHLLALQQLAEMLGDPTKVSHIRAAGSGEELFSLLVS